MSKTRVIWARPRRFEQGKMVEASRQSKSKIKALRRATANGFSYGPKAWKKNSWWSIYLHSTALCICTATTIMAWHVACQFSSVKPWFEQWSICPARMEDPGCSTYTIYACRANLWFQDLDAWADRTCWLEMQLQLQVRVPFAARQGCIREKERDHSLFLWWSHGHHLDMGRVQTRAAATHLWRHRSPGVAQGSSFDVSFGTS
jgi:hypothetical protein